MKSVVAALAAISLAVAPLASAAAAPISKNDIAKVLSQQGYAVQDYQPNVLAVSVSGYVVLVWVGGKDGDISYITYLSDVPMSEVGHDFLSKFNSEVKFGRAYVDRDGDIALQMDRNSAGGVSLANVESDFGVFLLLISKFLSDLESRPTV